jgi:hypothetical protein
MHLQKDYLDPHYVLHLFQILTTQCQSVMRRSVAWIKTNRSKKPKAAPLQGTEALAAESLLSNQKNFRYPASGFCSRIEYSLLYSMISRPDVYPQAVVQDAIRTEDFSEYLLVEHQQRQREGEAVCSYAQLSAILALASEKFPHHQESSSSTDPSATINIPQSLCTALLQCVIRHAEQNQLDRETEVQELLQPLERLTAQKGSHNALAVALPMYIGFGATVLAGGNPLPMWIGYVFTINAIGKQEQDQQALAQLASTTNRMADVEKTSLLMELDDRGE